ncbi:MAG: hypothetical protein HYT38_00260 [Candidatus Sungbacteria bacterium]|uniref:Uncharacterized protein n=1 Tax=Candidatus Sungiibacteriota bacterium TaxID=2750080 RepID=A0A931YDK8_9BACT|nr:hypothetical protein [Candidatus Sungbacteria bacterium]MBI2465951.1 hypothetical protein [Candidatus Sungbacteria bacterium]
MAAGDRMFYTYLLATALALMMVGAVCSGFGVAEYKPILPVVLITTALVTFTAVAIFSNGCGLPFPRVFGCLLAEAVTIGLVLYFFTSPMVVVGASVAGIVTVFVSLYLPCPRFLQRVQQVEEGGVSRHR